MTLNKSQFYRFGGLCFELYGWTSDILRHDLMDAFVVEPCKPDYRIRIYQDSVLDIPADGEVLHDVPRCRVTRKNNCLWAQMKTYHDGTMWTFAVLHQNLADFETSELQILVDSCSFSAESVLSSIFIESLLLRKGRAVLHSATINVGGRAILFSAPSGTGKSTQAELWQKYCGAEVINGDRIILRAKAGEEFACGLPFAGSSEICLNRELPIRAIVFLAQAKENLISRMGPMQAMKLLVSQISVQSWNQVDIETALTIAERVVLRVPVYHLACLPDESAVCALEQALTSDF